MRIASIARRAALVVGPSEYVDIESASAGRFSADVFDLLGCWDELQSWAETANASKGIRFEDADLDCPVLGARQIFAIGLNYADHALESGVTPPAEPAVFTKFVSSLTGPCGVVELPEGTVDWEAELVAVIGMGGRHLSRENAWDHVAALTIGQDLSERTLQHVGTLPQFSLAKSHAGFSPVGPFLVTPDELADANDLAIGCSVNGEQVQKSRTSQLIHSIPELVYRLSRVVELLPGDLIFTGTPGGVGAARNPARFLNPGDELVTQIEGLGELRHTFVPVGTITAGSQEG